MIAFAIVDGELHEREYQFLLIIAIELGVNKEELKQLFHEENRSEIIKSDFERGVTALIIITSYPIRYSHLHKCAKCIIGKRVSAAKLVTRVKNDRTTCSNYSTAKILSGKCIRSIG